MPAENHNEQVDTKPERAPKRISPADFKARVIAAETKSANMDDELRGLNTTMLSGAVEDRRELYEKYPKMAGVMKQIDAFLQNPEKPLPTRDALRAAYHEEGNTNPAILEALAEADKRGSCGVNTSPQLMSLYSAYAKRLAAMEDYQKASRFQQK